MKKIFIIILLNQLLFSCNKSENKKEQVDKGITTTKENVIKNDSISIDNPIIESPVFDISTLPISTEDIGDFPFFTAPKGATYINNVKPKDFDFMVFVTPDDIYKVEGKTFRAYVHPENNAEVEISSNYLNKSFEEAILKAGGVKVFEGELLDERKEKYKELCTYAGSNGSLKIGGNTIATYIIRREDGNVYIAFDKKKHNTMSIQIVEEKAFEQTIKKITSDEIEKDLIEKGKAILYINFDLDKATLKSDGVETVQEIVKVLNKNQDLAIAINGHTDNLGTQEYNQKLSEDRALTVKNEIIKSGIVSERLSSKGFGQKIPIADNNTEEGKAQNRRVELIKL